MKRQTDLQYVSDPTIQDTFGRPMLQRRPPPSFSNKVGRAIWGLVWLLLYRPSPRPFHFWRCMLLKLFGARIGLGAMPYPSARIWAPWNLVMGQGSVIGDDVDCYNVDVIELEARAIVSQRAYLCTADRDIRDPAMPLTTGPIAIRRRAWVAAEAYVAPGITVNDGAVAAARAVVVRDVEAWTVVAGNPAKPVGKRNQCREPSTG